MGQPRARRLFTSSRRKPANPPRSVSAPAPADTSAGFLVPDALPVLDAAVLDAAMLDEPMTVDVRIVTEPRADANSDAQTQELDDTTNDRAGTDANADASVDPGAAVADESTRVEIVESVSMATISATGASLDGSTGALDDGIDFASWTVSELSAALRTHGLPTSGTKAQLVERLRTSAAKDAY